MSKKLTKEQFIRKAREIHGWKYDYSKVEYIDIFTPVIIICPIHGEFLQKPVNHITRKCNCPKCSPNKKTTFDDFIKKAKEIHGDKYDYSKVEYKNSYTKVCIICPEHGEFWQKPNKHLSGQGCPKCYGLNKTTKEIVKELQKLYGNKYIYDKVEYINNKTKICLTCPKHGDFWATPKNLLNKHQCPQCSHRNYKYTINEFIKRAREVHGDKYDYSKVEYVNNKTKICIICPKHGEFWQTPEMHINEKNGCPFCCESKMENSVRNILKEKNIFFQEQKTFSWLKYKNNLRLDFYLPDYNIAIECQGIQHFQPVNFSGKDKETLEKIFELSQKRDLIKKEKCSENKLPLYYINYNDNIEDKINIILKENMFY